MEEDIRFHKGFTPVDPRGAASRTNSNWKLELCSLRRIYVQASGGGLIKLPRQWFRPDLISSWLVLLLPSSWTLSLSFSITKQQHRSTFRLPLRIHSTPELNSTIIQRQTKFHHLPLPSSKHLEDHPRPLDRNTIVRLDRRDPKGTNKFYRR